VYNGKEEQDMEKNEIRVPVLVKTNEETEGEIKTPFPNVPSSGWTYPDYFEA